MAQAKILIDSNVYFRLAQSIHPLLQIEFGQEIYCLYVIKDLQIEYERNQMVLEAVKRGGWAISGKSLRWQTTG